MKVLILGIDALEYNRVIEWDLKHLKLKEFGKTEVPISRIWTYDNGFWCTYYLSAAT